VERKARHLVTPRDGSEWSGGWTAVDPPEIGFAWAPNLAGPFVERDGLLSRELGLAETSGGAIGVRRIKVGDPEEAARWRALDVDFDFLFVLRGAVTVRDEAGGEVRLGTFDTALHPRLFRYRLTEFSEDFEALQVTAPARPAEDGAGPEASSGPLVGAPRGPLYTRERGAAYRPGEPPRDFFVYRDLETREATDGRLQIQVLRASETGPGTGWHYHTMAQWFMVIGGSAVIRVEDQPRQELGWGDSMCIGRGPRMRHEFADYSADYLALEVCVPAAYSTVVVDEPAGAAPREREDLAR
jgi:quercetin dioxygenase-like cupin family protein